MAIPNKFSKMTGLFPYQQNVPLLYLQSSSTQWIDTGIAANSENGYELSVLTTSFENKQYFGGGNSYSDGLGICTHGAGTLGFVIGREIITKPYDLENMHIYKVLNMRLFIDGTYVAASTTYSTSTNTMWLFRHSGSKSPTCNQKIFYCKFFDNVGNLVMDLVPRLYKIGGSYIDGNTNLPMMADTDKPGMYDNVSKKFFTNRGTGQFLYELA